MANRLFVVVGILALGLSALGQSKPSIQGVWRVTERTTTGPTGATNKSPQPGLWIFTAKHYSTVSDNSLTPRPAGEIVAPTPKLTDAQMIAAYQQWAPVTANAGSYEVTGTTLNLRPVVAKASGLQMNKTGLSYQFQIDGTSLVLTSVIGPTGKVANPTTIRLVRAE